MTQQLDHSADRFAQMHSAAENSARFVIEPHQCADGRKNWFVLKEGEIVRAAGTKAHCEHYERLLMVTRLRNGK